MVTSATFVDIIFCCTRGPTRGGKNPICVRVLQCQNFNTSLFTGDFRNLVDVNFCCAMGPPGGGRNPVSARLLRHFNFLTFTEMEDSSKRKIFGSIFKSWVGK